MSGGGGGGDSTTADRDDDMSTKEIGLRSPTLVATCYWIMSSKKED